MKLSEKIKQLPTTPGVYLMKDASGGILYVGKAKNLKRRVRSYFQNNKAHSPKTERLVKHLSDFDIILTDTEFEAFILECQLIQEIKPYYNRKMKNPQSYSYIEIKDINGFRNLYVTNRVEQSDNIHYFGPYSSKSSVERALELLKDCYKINCTNYGKNKSACLNYSLGKCIGICLGGSAREQYNHIIDKLIDLLTGKDTWLLLDIQQKMATAAEQFDFEKAAKLRDTVQIVEFLRHRERVIEFTAGNQNIIVLESLPDLTQKLFLIKGNNILLNEKIQTETAIEDISSLIQSAIQPYIGNNTSIPSKRTTQEEIDEVQIIYRYIKGSSCHYETIPDQYFEKKNLDKLNRVIIGLITREEPNS